MDTQCSGMINGIEIEYRWRYDIKSIRLYWIIGNGNGNGIGLGILCGRNGCYILRNNVVGEGEREIWSINIMAFG